MKQFKIHDSVCWKWAGGLVHGQVLEIYQAPVEKIIKGSRIKRNASKERPAYLVQSEAGNLALKLVSELMEPPKGFRPSKTLIT